MLKSAAPKLKREFCGSASNTKADPEGKGLCEKQQYDELPEFTLQLPQIFSDGLRSTFTQSKFSWGSMPPDPPTRLCILYIHGLVLGLLSDVLQVTNAQRPGNEASVCTDNCVLCAPHQSPLTLYICPPFFNLWIRP